MGADGEIGKRRRAARERIDHFDLRRPRPLEKNSPLFLPNKKKKQEAFEEGAWARRAAELSDADALEAADAALERYDARCALLAELFDGVPVSEALEKKKKRREQVGGEEEEEVAPRRSLAETVLALEREAAAATTTTTMTGTAAEAAAAAAAPSTSSASAAAASAASTEFEAVLAQLSTSRTRAEVSAAERAYLGFRAKRRRRGRKGGEGEGGGEEEQLVAVAAAAPLRTIKRRTVAPGLFEILLDDDEAAVPVPEPPGGAGLEL